MADWQILLIIVGVLFAAWVFLGFFGKYVVWRFPIVYMETSWMNLAEHMRQIYRRGVETWLFFRHNTGSLIRAFKYVVLNDPVIYFFIVVDWVKRDSPGYDRYAKALLLIAQIYVNPPDSDQFIRGQKKNPLKKLEKTSLRDSNF